MKTFNLLLDRALPANGCEISTHRNDRILVIDDTRSIHEDFRKILSGGASEQADWEAVGNAFFGNTVAARKRNTYTIDSAFQGGDGLALAREALAEGRPYALAFMDVRMPPGMDGIEATAKLWEIDPDIQVVMCTAYSDYSWEEMVEKMGNPDRLVILKKPFDMIEVLQLANALTEKWRLLQQSRRKMDKLEGLIDEATRNLRRTNALLEAEVAQRRRREECLALQHDVTRILADSTATAGEVTAKILQTVCESMKWQVGGLWTADLQPEMLRCTAIWHSPGTQFADFKTASQQMVFQPGTELPGSVWKSGQPAWIPDVTGDGIFLRNSAAAKAGLHCGFAFPLRLRGEILGVVEFFSVQKRQPEDDMLEMFGTLGSLIGQSIERKKLEERLRQAQKMDAVGQLAGGVAHDFNNILTVIQGYAQILKMNTALDRDTVDGLTQIALAAERGGNLTQQLLTFSRKRIMQAKSVDLNSVITNLAKMLRRVIGEDMALSFNYSPDCAIIHADEDMLGQVLMNLAVNARDAMPKGGKLGISTELITIGEPDVRGHGDSRAGQFVCLTVTDTGCGIPAENLSRIFEPFFTTKEVGRGTGLGLSTVYGIAKQHRGWIEVISQVGTGSTFRMFLPRTAHLALPANEKSGESTVPGGTETILLVEDEAPVRGLAKKILQRLGYQVVEAASGVEALEIWEQRGDEVQLLVTDMVMPGGITGRDLVEKLQAKRPGLKFVYTSGYSPNGTKEGERLLEGINFLQKPYQPRKLLEAVRERLDGTFHSN